MLQNSNKESTVASPQEVLELAIPCSPDATPESRRNYARIVIEALAVNDYHFVHRQLPVLEHDDGECSKCKCRLVHVMHKPAFENAEARIEFQRLRLEKLESALRDISQTSTDQNTVTAANQALY